ncbi:hypothetical protein [Lutimonas sp.]|uniref:hypothetical protein n=1 Tax=Lutimonas sp. TaxID=1872403 RepID=UPI003D9ABFD0
MKIVRLLCMFTLVSILAISCKETKKEDVQDDAAVEMTDESVDSEEAVEATTPEPDISAGESDNSGAAASAGAAAAGGAEAHEAAKGIEAETKGIEEVPVPEGVIAEELADTSVIYPGCSGTAEEIRACNRKSFVEFIQNEFDKNIGPSLNLGTGDFQIRSFLHIDESGKMSALKVVAPHPALETEMKRVIAKVPTVVPATKDGKPVGITFMLPVKFQVEL